MTKTAPAIVSALLSVAAFAGYVQHVAVDVADSRQNYAIRVARGEVVDLSIDYFDEGAPLDISGSEVVLHTRTNGMDLAESWQTPGTVSSNSALFTLDVDAKMPFVSGSWSVDFVRNGEKVTRPGGQAWVRGTAAGTVAADPVSALSGYATTGYVAQAVAAIDVTESDPVWEAEKDDYARKGDLGSAAFVDTPRKYALDATNIVGITIQPLTTSDWEANYIGGFAISPPDYDSVSLSFPDDFTETEGGWFGSIEVTKTAPRQIPRYLGSVTITNLVFGGEMATMTSSTVECSMDCFADWQGDSDNIHFVFPARSDWHDGWMPVGEAADLAASRAAVAATNYTDAAVAAIDIPDPDLSFTNDFVKTESDPVWEAEKGGYATTNDATYTINGKRLASNSILFTNGWGVAIDEISKSSLIHGFLGLTGIRISLSDEFFDELGETLYGLRQSQEEAAVAATNYTDAAIAAIPTPDLSFTNDFLKAESDPVWSEWVAARTNEAGWFYAETAGTAYEAREAINAGKLGGNESSFFARASDLAAAASAATNYTDEAVAALDYATPGDIADEISAASNALARAWSADSVLLSSMLLGSNVVAEVTNYNSQVRSPTLRLLQLNESNEYFQVWAETNNLSRVALAATNHADTVSAAAYVAATNYAAPRAWSGTTSGLGADAPEGWTWISTPQMAIAGGLEYEKNITSGGAIWILKSNGMAADFHSVSNNTAYLDISATDGSSLFRIEKTDSFLVGVDTTSVNVSGDALICGVNCVSATHPLVRVRQSLTQGDWSREEDGIPANLATVEWSGESGAWVCEITNTSGGHSMFATMEMLQEGGAKLVNAASLDVSSSGILCTDGVHKVRPVYNNGSITWEVFQ